ncbi:DUF3883 domain-containing protein [Streptomyces sp. NPDC005500]|uniref:DUF3883 domain-containing protein n=1 Tax=Streptomyces sp. NPDC005500 TaxID=3155007 RepID=UPI0033B3AADF
MQHLLQQGRRPSSRVILADGAHQASGLYDLPDVIPSTAEGAQAGMFPRVKLPPARSQPVGRVAALEVEGREAQTWPVTAVSAAETASFVMIHVGQKPNSQENLEYGLETQSWGFPKWVTEYRTAAPRFAVLATGAGPRVQLDEWLTKRATLYLCEVRTGFYEGRAPHWPDEQEAGDILYPVRFGIEPLAVIDDVSLSADGPLGLQGSDAVRRSGIEQGIGKLVDLSPQTLLDLTGIPTDWSIEQTVPLDKAPGVPARKVAKTARASKKGSGTGYQADPLKRKAVELYAEDKAVAHYEAQGWTVDRIGKPYDLCCTRKGGLERHVEVKGTTGAPTSVELTINEVEHARDPENTVDLYVVSDIRIEMCDGEYRPSCGVVTHRVDWEPADEDLRPRKFEYRIPPE